MRARPGPSQGNTGLRHERHRAPIRNGGPPTTPGSGWTALLGAARGGPDVSPYAAPARAADLAGLPPAFIDVGSVDIFRDEDIDYAARLSRAGTPVEFHLWPGGFHGFEDVGPDSALARAALAARVGYLRRALASA